MLQEVGGHWVEELPGVLWEHRTTQQCPIGETLFFLAYDMEVVIPTQATLQTT